MDVADVCKIPLARWIVKAQFPRSMPGVPLALLVDFVNISPSTTAGDSLTRPILALILLVAPSGEAISQHLRLGVDGGLSFIDMPNYYTQDVSSGGLGFMVELHAGASGKLELPESPFTLTGRVQYTWMTGSGNVVSNQLYASAGNYSTFQDIFVVAAGVEWVVSRMEFYPHISTEILLAEVGHITVSSNSSDADTPFLKDPYTRVGFALGAGLEHQITSSLNTDLHIRYNWNRLFGRAPGEGNLNTLDVSLAFYLVLY